MPSRKKDSSSATPPSEDDLRNKVKRKRQSQSCDACRARKVRCARENPDDQKQSCKHCITLGIPCTYDYQPKKRGPPNLYLRRLQEAAAAAAAVTSPTTDTPTTEHEASTSPVASPVQKNLSVNSAASKSPPPGFLEPTLKPAVTNVPVPPSRYQIAADTYHPQFNSPPANFIRPAEMANMKLEEFHSPTESFSTYPLHNWLDEIAPRDTISLIIALFFDFVYPLTPCVHKPSFMADLHARREERDPLFFALVMSTVASTLVQVPRSYVPMERPVVRKLAQVTLRLHEEAAYAGLDPIEAEVRRRVFWLLFGADKSMSILLGRPICLRDEDCTLHFPKELDDEYITPSAYLPQPQGKTAIVSGLNYTSRIFALLGEILVRIRVDKRSPPQGQFATARLEEVQSLHSRICAALSHCPEPLRLKRTFSTDVPAEYGGAGFRQATFAEVKDFFDNPNASRENALNPFLVVQGNIYVTQQLVRFVIEQYRDELMLQINGTIDEHKVAEDREAVASDLLNILHSIPIQSIATNGPSLVHKVRFVASTLLDAVRKAETAPASAARAHAYLWDFLSILSEIERNYLLDDDRDGTSSGDVRIYCGPLLKVWLTVMRNATILVLRLKGTATEVIKNIVLSGIGKLVIIDSGNVVEEDLGAGFFFRDEDVGKQRVNAARERIESLNPLVTVETIDTFPGLEALDAVIQTVDLVCVTDWDKESLVRINATCRRLGKPFYAGGTYGVLGYIFCDLLTHEYVAPDNRSLPKDQQKSIKFSATYPPLADALAHKWTQLTKRQTKEVNPAVVFTILGIWEYQKRHGNLPADATAASELQSISDSLLSAADVRKQVLETVPSDLVASSAETAGAEFSPVCAIVGGMLAQDILKTLGARDAPIANFFVFDGTTGGGTTVQTRSADPTVKLLTRDANEKLRTCCESTQAPCKRPNDEFLGAEKPLIRPSPKYGSMISVMISESCAQKETWTRTFNFMEAEAIEYDCIVVGSGHAGSCAAFSAVESGCKNVLLVDVCPPEWVGGNGYFTAGAIRTVHGGLEDLLPIVSNVSESQAQKIDLAPYTREEFFADIMRMGAGKPDAELVGAIVDASRDAVTWLKQAVGVPFWVSFHRQAYVDPDTGREKFWGGLALCTEDGGKGLIAAHQKALAAVDVETWFNSRAVEIETDGEKVSGLILEKEDGRRVRLGTRAVVLAAGGFEASPELRAKYLGAGWERAILKRAMQVTGHTLQPISDGFMLAEALGARRTGDWEGCHSTCWDADAPLDGGNRELTNQYTKSGYPIGLMINAEGNRFVDEGEDFRNYTYAKFGRAILNQPGSYTFQVWDSKVTNMLRKEEYGDGITTKIFADTLEELATKLQDKGLQDRHRFVDTINKYNTAVKSFEAENAGATWDPAVKDGRSTQSSATQLAIPKSNWALTIDQGPFMAVKVACGVTFTFGGLAIDPVTAGVLSDRTGEPIPGLFCTGEMVGSLFYHNYPGGSGLTAGAVFGRRAGQAAAKLARA
ncbi:Fumarate reductase flavoprotein subunit [Mycena chlorophos]|uniref:Fumarate reductase flavoprotein subunit n=1 Tax=Mycena chlorophos TaxID=658473 RepID=A0A8H6S4J1_MYCCL|nr:Fumarate reductase flavoprotein subunit [Mycena chlorophos]